MVAFTSPTKSIGAYEAEQAVRSRLRGVHGLTVECATDRLEVEIVAHSVQAADFAEDALADVLDANWTAWSECPGGLRLAGLLAL